MGGFWGQVIRRWPVDGVVSNRRRDIPRIGAREQVAVVVVGEADCAAFGIGRARQTLNESQAKTAASNRIRTLF